MFLGRTGTQTHLSAPGGLHHCAGPAVHEEAHGHADQHHDQGTGSPLNLHKSSLLYCTVLHCTVLYCTVLYCTVLYMVNLP